MKIIYYTASSERKVGLPWKLMKVIIVHPPKQHEIYDSGYKQQKLKNRPDKQILDQKI